jgi:hypothetical protein
MKVFFTLKSGNIKVGKIPVSTSEQSTCPDSCKLKGSGCYAETGPISWHWKKIPDKGMKWEKFIHAIKALPDGQFWRHNQAGDLAGDVINIDKQKLEELVEANEGLKGFTYTHYKGEENLKLIKQANENGFTINLSADHISEVDELVAKRVAPVVVVMPEDFVGIKTTEAGNKILACPASVGGLKDCDACRACQVVGRHSVIGFPAHGASKKRVFNNVGGLDVGIN